jgi:beta-1,2-mannobiose phosphorylase / 1,2-beta-oligomannan phosphorylase
MTALNTTLPPTETSYQLQRLGTLMQGAPNNPDEALGVLNPAVARAVNGKVYLFPRIVATGNYSRIGLAEVIFNQAGDPDHVIRKGYALEPTEPFEQNARTAGCEDPRISFVEPLGCYVMAYCAYGPLGPRIALAYSKDLLQWQRLGPAKFKYTPELRADFDLYDNKDAMLFPQPVIDPHGKPALAMLHRPSNLQGFFGSYLSVLPAGVTEPRASIWISYCDVDAAQRDLCNLCHWRDHQLLATPQQAWEVVKIGGGTPPVLTKQGWLMFYHGVSGTILPQRDHQPMVRYAAGAMLLDKADPRIVLHRSAEPVLQPEVEAEQKGVVPNVVFPTGIDARENGRVDVYYGMADAAIGVATLTLSSVGKNY